MSPVDIHDRDQPLSLSTLLRVSDATLQLPFIISLLLMSSDEDAASVEISDYWPADIIAEKGKRYKVQWEGINPVTRKPWAPEWIPKERCNDPMVEDWEDKQAKKREANSKSKKSE